LAILRKECVFVCVSSTSLLDAHNISAYERTMLMTTSFMLVTMQPGGQSSPGVVFLSLCCFALSDEAAIDARAAVVAFSFAASRRDVRWASSNTVFVSIADRITTQ